MYQTLTKAGSNSAKLRLRLRLVAVLCAIAGTLALFVGPTTFSANPTSGTVSEANPVVTWDGPVFQTPTGSATCGGPNDPACDNFSLNVVPPSSGSYQVKITIQPFGAGDWDLQVYSGNAVVGSSGNAPGAAEFVTLSNPAAGIYTVAAAPFAPQPGVPGSYSGRAELIKVATPPPPPPPGTEPVSYFNHVAPAPLGRPSSDEPSIGLNWKTDKAMFVGALDTYRVSFDDCSSPAKDTWEDKSFIYTSLITLDPILFTDRLTGRTIVSQLSAKCSSMAFSDNDGDSWLPTQGCGINSGVDHQTVGGGPFAAPLTRDPNGPLYPNAVYYCSQDVAIAQCARSDTGGLTFGPAVPIYDLTECGGLHGHIKVAPDGTVYVPNKGCNGIQAAVVSENNGITWDVRHVPDALAGDTDPSIGIATNGNVYFGWDNAGVEPKIAVSTNKGVTWSNTANVGAIFNVTNTAFPAVVAGDPNRAAFAFHGCPSCPPGGLGDDPNYAGDWFLFVAHTYDGGLTWTTVNATPNDPIQRATICTAGINCANGTRNLLDFFDATVDRQGRVLVGYADGCVGNCVNARPNSFTAVSTIARQVNGRRLFAQFDTPTVPAAPLVTATFNNCPNPTAVIVTWSKPDDRGSPITAYNIYRRTGTSGSFTLLATVGGNVNKYSDNTINPALTYFYRVTAVNAQGEGLACGESSVTCPGGGANEDPCVFPGVTVLEDATGDFTLPAGMQSAFGPALDLQKLSIAEPLNLGAGKLMFVLKVASLQNVPPNTTWPILFNSPNPSPAGTDFAARMHTNALGQVFFTVATGANNVNPVLNAGVPADPASGFSADGTIRIVVSRAAIGNPAPNQILDMFLVRVRSPEGGATALTPDNMPDSLARSGTYTVKGSENCTPPNSPPNAVDDSATTTRNTPVVINVVANDTDPDLDPLTVTAVSDPPHGTATNNNNGTVTYQPDNGFIGSDSFTYTISDGRGGSDTATVRVTVNPPPNRPPDARDDTASTCKNRPKRINVLANDSDPDGDPLTVGAVTQPANGTATNNGDGTVTYTPRRDFVGTDSFTYTISDGRGGSDTARVTVNVRRCDDDGEDDDDFDDDGDRDDGDSDDDNDGEVDDQDSDDDNDGERDDQDSDDDNDNIDDEFDSESSKESQHSSSADYAGGSQTQYVMVADANTLLLTALVEAANAQTVTVEIYGPSGLMVARSLPTPGRALAIAPVTSPGNYTVRVRNNGVVTVSSKTVLITSSKWLNLGAALYKPLGQDSNALVNRRLEENIRYLALRAAMGVLLYRLV